MKWICPWCGETNKRWDDLHLDDEVICSECDKDSYVAGISDDGEKTMFKIHTGAMLENVEDGDDE